MNFEAHHGDCLDILKTLPDNSVDSIVTDPPYGLSFMGRKWDYDVPSTDIWAECLRVLKPGGHLLAFAGTRTQHRMAVRIEDAGFEIRDMISWVFGSGFPKSMDVSKAIDKAAGAEREKVLVPTKPGNTRGDRGVTYASESNTGFTDISEPVTEAARQWQGWGTALKPALEPITMARKPFKGTVADNVLAHGTGALNIDACRVPTSDDLNGGAYSAERKPSASEWVKHGGTIHNSTGKDYVQPAGRWPANLIHDGSDEVVAGFPATGPAKAGMRGIGLTGDDVKVYGKGNPNFDTLRGHNDQGGSAARFFYCAKASKSDRDVGLTGFATQAPRTTYDKSVRDKNGSDTGYARANHHPTVKPTDLMRYLVRLVTPPGGVVLDPFMGSGSTGKAALLEGFRFIGCEREAEYLAIANARIAHALQRTEAESQPGPLFA